MRDWTTLGYERDGVLGDAPEPPAIRTGVITSRTPVHFENVARVSGVGTHPSEQVDPTSEYIRASFLASLSYVSTPLTGIVRTGSIMCKDCDLRRRRS